MYLFKNKLIYLIFTISIILFIIPSYIYASNNTSFVWSDASNPTVETVSSLTEGKR